MITLHLAMAVYTVLRIIRTDLFTTGQKRINIFLALVTPYLWSVLMYYMLRKESMVFDEDKQHEHTSHDFHESGKGFLGH